MVKINIEELLEREGKSKYWLCNQMNITTRNLNRIILGLTKSISFKYVAQFCYYLNCSPEELFTVIFEDENKED